MPGSEFSIDIELVLLAMGFLHTEYSSLIKGLKIALDENSNIKTDGRYMTNIKNIFAAGDAGTGASLVVRAIAHGVKAAESIIKQRETITEYQ